LLRQANVFNVKKQATIPERLQNMVTKEVATTGIEESLLNANRSKRKMLKSVRPSKPTETLSASAHHYSYVGRRVDLPQILSRELMAVPLAIFDASSQLRTGNKSVIMELLSSGTERRRVTPIAGRSTIIVDGQALVMALNGDKFVKAVLASGKDFDRIDVTFDRYRETSIKCATRKKHSRGHAPIRRIIEDGSVLLPKSWSNFVALDEYKADLARFLSDKLLAGAPVNKIVTVGGGRCSQVFPPEH